MVLGDEGAGYFIATSFCYWVKLYSLSADFVVVFWLYLGLLFRLLLLASPFDCSLNSIVMLVDKLWEIVCSKLVFRVEQSIYSFIADFFGLGDLAVEGSDVGGHDFGFPV